MSYGIEIKNTRGNTVVDSEFESLFLENEVTLTGSKVFASLDVWEYDFAQTGYSPFFQVPVNHWVAYCGLLGGNPRFFGSQSSFNVRKTIPISQISYTPPSSGIEIYDESENLLFSSSEDFIPIKGFTNDMVNEPSGVLSFSSITEWVCPIRSPWHIIPGGFNESVVEAQAIIRLDNYSFYSDSRPIGVISQAPIGASGGEKVAGLFS